MIRASFSDHLKVRRCPQSGVDKILYDHDLRCELKVWLEETKENKLGWRVNIQGNDHVVGAMKKEILNHTVGYLKQRLRKDLSLITYSDIVMLSDSKLIRSVRKK